MIEIVFKIMNSECLVSSENNVLYVNSKYAEMSDTGVLNNVNLVQYLNVLYLKSRIQFKFRHKSFTFYVRHEALYRNKTI